MDILNNCTLCPRKCGVNRSTSSGICKAGKNIKIARAALHHWEEPCISGTGGSGTIFFCGCNLRCVYCQNYEISFEGYGKEITVPRLGQIFLDLQEKGAHNINLVTPTPYIPLIIQAIDTVRDKIHIPFVYNTGGYETTESLDMLSGYIDIFLTDVKYFDYHMAKRYSNAPDYFDIAIKALEKMLEITKPLSFNKYAIMQSGVIVRHLVLPGCRHDSIKILEYLASQFDINSFILSLMSQYTPNEHLDAFSEINRRITSFEYNSVTDVAINLGFKNIYFQEKSSAKKDYTPPFDLSGV